MNEAAFKPEQRGCVVAKAEHTKRLEQADPLEKVFRDLISKAAEAASSNSHNQSSVMKASPTWLIYWL